MTFAVEDRVKKVGGSYYHHIYGTISARWVANDGTMRYSFVFDFPAGMVHIFSDSNLELMTPSDEINSSKIKAFLAELTDSN